MAKEEKQEVQLSDFVKARLAVLPWDDLKAQFGITREYVENNQRLATQLANSSVTDYLYANATVGNMSIYGPVALQVLYSGEGDNLKASVKHFTPNPNIDLKVFGNDISSDDIRANLVNTYQDYIKIEGKPDKRVLLHSYNNGGFPITLSYKDKDGNTARRQVLVSLDAYEYNKKGEIYRGTNRIFTMPVTQVRTYLDNVCKGIYQHEFTEAEKDMLAKGKPIILKDCVNIKKGGEVFQCCVQFDAVSRTVKAAETPGWREAKAQAYAEKKAEAAAQKNVETKTEKKTENKKTAKENKPSTGIARG